MDAAQLHQEITTDPEAIGYRNPDTSWKGDQAIADLLNDPANGASITRRLVGAQEILSSIPIAEWRTAAAADRAYLQGLLGLSGEAPVDTSDPVVLANLLELFAGGSETRTNLLAKIQRQGSRAEVLWGESVTVTAGAVAQAANVGS